jgi:hypothetical protein
MVPLFSAALNFFPDQISIKNWKEPKNIFVYLGLGFVVFSLVTNAVSSTAVYQEYFEKEDLLLACHSASANDTDGIPVTLDEGKWYRLEEFNTTATQTKRQFTIIQGPGQVTATEEEGILAWQCTDEQAAIFASSRYAKYFKRSNPLVRVFGPDGDELR